MMSVPLHSTSTYMVAQLRWQLISSHDWWVYRKIAMQHFKVFVTHFKAFLICSFEVVFGKNVLITKRKICFLCSWPVFVAIMTRKHLKGILLALAVRYPKCFILQQQQDSEILWAEIIPIGSWIISNRKLIVTEIVQNIAWPSCWTCL